MATKKQSNMSIKSTELRKLMDSFLTEVVDIDDRQDFHFAFCSLLTYVVDKEMERNSDINTIKDEIIELNEQLDREKEKHYKITLFDK